MIRRAPPAIHFVGIGGLNCPCCRGRTTKAKAKRLVARIARRWNRQHVWDFITEWYDLTD